MDSYSFSIHSTVLGEESTFEYPHPDPELNKPLLEETSLSGDSASATSMVSEGFEVRVCEFCGYSLSVYLSVCLLVCVCLIDGCLVELLMGWVGLSE